MSGRGERALQSIAECATKLFLAKLALQHRAGRQAFCAERVFAHGLQRFNYPHSSRHIAVGEKVRVTARRGLTLEVEAADT